MGTLWIKGLLDKNIWRNLQYERRVHTNDELNHILLFPQVTQRNLGNCDLNESGQVAPQAKSTTGLKFQGLVVEPVELSLLVIKGKKLQRISHPNLAFSRPTF